MNFTVPSNATPGVTGVRVRLTSTSSPGADGLDGNGEVEDNTFTITCSAITFTPAILPDATVSSAYS